MTREGLIETLKGALLVDPGVRAAWLGGSDATGAVDALSDIDLVALVHPDEHDPAHAAVRQAIGEAVGVEDEWALPSPAWHGGKQTFWQARGLGFPGLVDFVTLEPERAAPFFVVERHGSPKILFDPEGLVIPAPLDRAEHERALREAVENARGKLMLVGRLASKEAQRGRPADSAQFYHELVIAPLALLLRAFHCPDRYDFKERYIRRDLPETDAARLERLMYPASADAIPAMVEEARAWGAEVSDELARRFSC